MSNRIQQITSLQNQRVKDVVKLNKRSFRDEKDLLIVEGYRELKRALENGWSPEAVYFCPSLFLGENERQLLRVAEKIGAKLFECTDPVFRKIAYRDRPEGILAVGIQVRSSWNDIHYRLPESPFIIVAESIEKPGNLGTILRSADAAGVDAVIVCDKCTDISNPNVVRASIGTLFSLPVIEAGSDEAISWLRDQSILLVAATPHAEREYTDANLSGGVAVIVGSEQYGLSERWMKEADLQVVIPMLGQADSLNVASATTILLYEVVRQQNRTLRHK